MAIRLKMILKLLVHIQLLATTQSTYAQGWVAEIDLDLNHSNYGYERIDDAILTFSGITVQGSSETSTLSFVLSGNDPMSGNINLAIDGLAWDPYDSNDPATDFISATYSGNYTVPCVRGFFRKNGQTPSESISIWITIYPRMQISQFIQECDKLTLISNTCSASFVWEVSENISGGFKTMEGKSTSTIEVTREELLSMGFSTPFGRKYFRVTGRHQTTSQLQPVDIYFPPPNALVETVDPRCYGASDGSAVLNILSASQAITDFVVTLRNAQSTAVLEQRPVGNGEQITFQNLANGHYNVRVENNTNINTYGSCWVDVAFKLTHPDPIVISSTDVSNFNGFQVTCTGAANGSIIVNPSGGTGEFVSYSWTPDVSTTNVASDLVEGTYNVRIGDSNGCWSDDYTYQITEPDKLALNLLSTGGKNGFDVSCYDQTDGQVEVEVAGGAGAYSYQWSDGEASAVRTNLGPGALTVTVSDGNGCTQTEEIQLFAPVPISFAIRELQQIDCPGKTGSLEIHSIENAIGEVSTEWSSGETTLEITDKPAGTYVAMVSDAQGCNASRTYELNEPPSASVAIQQLSDYNGAAISCHGARDGHITATLSDDEGSVVDGDFYKWYRNGTEFLSGSSPSADSLPAGSYKVEATYRSFCKVDATILVEEPQMLSVLISNVSDYNGNAISCAGSKDAHIRAIASGGTGDDYTFEWSTNDTSQDISGIGAGTYQVIVRDINGCAASGEKLVDEPDSLSTVITLLSSISCWGASDARIKAIPKGGTFPYQFAWSTGDDSQELNHQSPGDYSVVTNDANGCSSAAEITIASPTPVIAALLERSDYNGFGVSCNGTADGLLRIGVSGGTSEYRYVWDDQTNGEPLRTHLKSGTYTVKVLDKNGCADSLEATLTEPEELHVVALHVRNVSCHNGNDGEITLAAEGGSGAFQYAVNGIWQDSPIIGSLRAGFYTPYVRDLNNCVAFVSQRITEPLPLTIQFEGLEPSLCGEAVGKVASKINGGTGSYTLAWTDDRGNFLGDSSALTELPPGVYTLKVRDANNCAVSAPVAIPSTDGPAIHVLNTTPTSCSYTSDGTAALEMAGNGPFSIRWPDGNTSAYANNLRKGDYIVTVVDSDNCLSTANITIEGPDSLVVSVLENKSPTCTDNCNGSLTVTGLGGNGTYQYQWSNSNGPSLDSLCAGSYTVHVSDQKDCTANETIRIVDPPRLIAEVTGLAQPNCRGSCNGSIEISASGGTGDLHFGWTHGAANPYIGMLCPGEYTVIVTDDNQCSVAISNTIRDPIGAVVELGDSVVVCQGQTHVLDAGPTWDTYEWGSDKGPLKSDRHLMLSSPGTYWIAVTDEIGCVSRDTFLLRVANDLLEANFLLTSSSFLMDTVVAIDITWPMPSSAKWTFPEEMVRLRDLGDIVYGQFTRPGTYEVTLTASLGECQDQMTKKLIVTDSTNSRDPGGRLRYEPFLEEFTVYPNPSNGDFEVIASFDTESPVVFTVFELVTSRVVARIEDRGKATYAKKIDLAPISPGAYTLRLDHRKGTAYKTLIVR